MTTTKYICDGLDVVAEVTGSGAVKYVRTLNMDEPLARIQPGGVVRYYHTDALGSVIALTDGSGNVKTAYRYSPFGQTEAYGEASTNPYQYTGRENDGPTLLYHYRARYYSPILRRFISQDPIGFAGGDVNWYAYVDSVGKPPETNLYSYAGNSPVNWIDPYGLFKVGPAPLLSPEANPYEPYGIHLDAPPAGRPLSRRDKCMLAGRLASIAPCLGFGMAVGEITVDPWAGLGTNTACKAGFEILFAQLCPEEEERECP